MSTHDSGMVAGIEPTNLAHIPTHASDLYPTAGVDFLYDPELAAGRANDGHGVDPVEWVELDEFDLDTAQDVITARGLRIVGGLAGLDYTAAAEYAVATLESITAAR